MFYYYLLPFAPGLTLISFCSLLVYMGAFAFFVEAAILFRARLVARLPFRRRALFLLPLLASIVTFILVTNMGDEYTNFNRMFPYPILAEHPDPTFYYYWHNQFLLALNSYIVLTLVVALVVGLLAWPVAKTLQHSERAFPSLRGSVYHPVMGDIAWNPRM